MSHGQGPHITRHTCEHPPGARYTDQQGRVHCAICGEIIG